MIQGLNPNARFVAITDNNSGGGKTKETTGTTPETNSPKTEDPNSYAAQAERGRDFKTWSNNPTDNFEFVSYNKDTYNNDIVNFAATFIEKSGYDKDYDGSLNFDEFANYITGGKGYAPEDEASLRELFEELQLDKGNTEISKEEFAVYLATLDANDGTLDGKISADQMNYVKSAGGAGNSLPLRAGSNAQTDENGTYVVADAWSNVESENNCLSRIINNNYDLAAMGIKLYSPEYYELEQMVKDANQDIYGNGGTLHPGDRVNLPGVGNVEFEGFEIQKPDGFEVPETPQNGVVTHDNGDGTQTVTRYFNGEPQSVVTKDASTGQIINLDNPPLKSPNGGNALNIDNPDGSITTYIYDENGNLSYARTSGLKDEDGNKMQTITNYDENGNKATSETTTFVGDSGRIANRTTITYDENGNQDGDADVTYVNPVDGTPTAPSAAPTTTAPAATAPEQTSPEIPSAAPEYGTVPGADLTDDTFIDFINEPVPPSGINDEKYLLEFVPFKNKVDSMDAETRINYLKSVYEQNPELFNLYTNTTFTGDENSIYDTNAYASDYGLDFSKTVAEDLAALGQEDPMAAAAYWTTMENMYDQINGEGRFQQYINNFDTTELLNALEIIGCNSTAEQIAVMKENGFDINAILADLPNVTDSAKNVYARMLEQGILGGNTDLLNPSKYDDNPVLNAQYESYRDITEFLDDMDNMDPDAAYYILAKFANGSTDNLVEALTGGRYTFAERKDYFDKINDFYTNNEFNNSLPSSTSTESVTGNDAADLVLQQILDGVNSLGDAYNYDINTLYAKISDLNIDTTFSLLEELEKQGGTCSEIAQQLFNKYSNDHDFNEVKANLKSYPVERQAQIADQYYTYKFGSKTPEEVLGNKKNSEYLSYVLEIYKNAENDPEALKALTQLQFFAPENVIYGIEQNFKDGDETTVIKNFFAKLEKTVTNGTISDGFKELVCFDKLPADYKGLIAILNNMGGAYSDDEIRAALIEKFGDLNTAINALRTIHDSYPYKDSDEEHYASLLAQLYTNL